MPLLGGPAVPPHGLGSVLRHTFAFVVHGTEVVLGNCMLLLDAPAVPLHGLGSVLRHTLAFGVHGTEVDLGNCVPLLGVCMKPSYRCDIVTAFIRRLGFFKCLRRRGLRTGKTRQQRQQGKGEMG